MKNLNIPISQGDILFGIYQKKTGDDKRKYGINAVRVVEITLTFTQEIHIYLDSGIMVALTDLPAYFYLTYDEAKMICDQLNNEGGEPTPDVSEDDLEDHFDTEVEPAPAPEPLINNENIEEITN